MELGTFDDLELMFDALAVASQQAYEWEEMLVPLDDGARGIVYFDEDLDEEDLEDDDYFEDESED